LLFVVRFVSVADIVVAFIVPPVTDSTRVVIDPVILPPSTYTVSKFKLLRFSPETTRLDVALTVMVMQDSMMAVIIRFIVFNINKVIFNNRKRSKGTKNMLYITLIFYKFEIASLRSQ
jgi:voltage-gated potassium channel Kch